MPWTGCRGCRIGTHGRVTDAQIMKKPEPDELTPFFRDGKQLYGRDLLPKESETEATEKTKDAK